MKLLVAAIGCMMFTLGSAMKVEHKKAEKVQHKHAKPTHLSAGEVDQLLDSVLGFFDKDKDNVITNAEIRQVSEGTGKLQENLDQFGQADSDKNGDITKEELKTMFEGPVPGSEPAPAAKEAAAE